VTALEVLMVTLAGVQDSSTSPVTFHTAQWRVYIVVDLFSTRSDPCRTLYQNTKQDWPLFGGICGDVITVLSVL
jgi:hypothetical protein